MTDPVREARTILLRRASRNEPTELVINDDKLGCLVFRLRLGQLRDIALEAVQMILKTD